MHQFFAVVSTLAVLLAPVGCGGPAGEPHTEAEPPAQTAPAETEDADGTEDIAVILTIGDRSFSATLNGGEAARALAETFPRTLSMSEMNGNEKYYYLDDGLPTAPASPGQIAAGDIMLYGSDCLVLFYESFSSSYQYTRLGSVDDPAGLAAALGAGGAAVTWALA